MAEQEPTHKVLKRLAAAGRIHEVGDLVSATDWSSVKALEKAGFLKRLPKKQEPEVKVPDKDDKKAES